jgi:type II secretory pathway pseudopilin PulG
MRRIQGLSLVELMVALSFFAITAAALFSFTMSNMQLRRGSQFDNVAIQYANSIVEAYKAHWSVLDNYTNGADPNISNITDTSYPPNFQAPERNTAICLQTNRQVIPCNGTPPLRRLTVRIRDQQGKVRAELTTEIGVPANRDTGGAGEQEEIEVEEEMQ